MEARRYIYSLKLWDGRLLKAEGTGWENAAKAAGVKLRDVKRSLPVKALPTAEELEERKRRFAELRKRGKGDE